VGEVFLSAGFAFNEAESTVFAEGLALAASDMEMLDGLEAAFLGAGFSGRVGLVGLALDTAFFPVVVFVAALEVVFVVLAFRVLAVFFTASTGGDVPMASKDSCWSLPSLSSDLSTAARFDEDLLEISFVSAPFFPEMCSTSQGMVKDNTWSPALSSWIALPRAARVWRGASSRRITLGANLSSRNEALIVPLPNARPVT